MVSGDFLLDLHAFVDNESLDRLSVSRLRNNLSFSVSLPSLHFAIGDPEVGKEGFSDVSILSLDLTNGERLDLVLLNSCCWRMASCSNGNRAHDLTNDGFDDPKDCVGMRSLSSGGNSSSDEVSGSFGFS